MEPFNCHVGNSTGNSSENASANSVDAWSQDKRTWCCKNELRGCTTTTTSSTGTSTVTRTTSTTTTSTFTVSTTTTVDGCGLTFCSMKEKPGASVKNSTCRSHIHELSFHLFLGDAGSCSKARNFVLDNCIQCSICPAKLAGCGVLEAPTTTPGSTTPVGPCESKCTLGGQSHSCGDRIKWSSTHPPFVGSSDACPRAHDLVAKQCPACGECDLAEVEGCEPPPTQEPVEDDAAVSSESYDCQTRLRQPLSEWSAARKSWCCQQKKIGCQEIEDVRVLITDYNEDSEENQALAHAAWSRRVIVGFSVVGFITFAALLVVVNRRPAAALSGYTNTREVVIMPLDHIVLE